MPWSKRLKQALKGALKTFKMIAPMLLGVMGLVGLFQSVVTQEMLQSVFSGNTLYDMLSATLIGGVSVGQPFISYIIGGEMLKEGVSLYAVTSFILAWVTLGVIQLPLEYSLFGARFTIVRNVLAFVFAMIVSVLTVGTLELLS